MVQRVATKIAVVGAGYAGLACAVELADAGLAVDVFEASRTLGGRARAVEIDGMTVDNGAHILVGAYRDTLRLLGKIGGGESALRRTALHLEFADGFRLSAPKLPAPLHLAWALLGARGLRLGDKLSAIGFMQRQKAAGFRLSHDITAAELLAGQPDRVRRYLWEPLCLAALNTPVGLASAQVFLNVLRDSLAAGRAASDLLLPTTDFSRLLPEPAAAFVEARGGHLFRSTRIQSLANVGAGWTANEYGPYQQVVLAVAPYHLDQLLQPHPEFTALLQQVSTLHWQPIAAIYLQYPAHATLPFPMLGLEGGHAQWLFDRGALHGQHGLISVVISGSGDWQALSHDALAATVAREIARALPDFPPALRHWVIEEKRATFSCTPALARPTTATACPNLWLAGDYVAGDYPATLEGAVRSGIAAAQAVRAALS